MANAAKSWFALKLGEVSVDVELSDELELGLTANLEVDGLAYNSATNGATPIKRLNWAKAFDLDGDGQFDDALNPGALLPVAQDLTIDFASSLQLRLTGTLTGDGGTYASPEAGFADVEQLLLEVGPLHLGGTAAFALSISTVDADTDGNGSADLIGATLTGFALDVQDLTVLIDKEELILGQWQGIYLCEFDGPRERRVVLRLVDLNPVSNDNR